MVRATCACLSLSLLLVAAGAAGADTGFSSGVGVGDVESTESSVARGDNRSRNAADAGNWWQDADGPGLRLIHAGAYNNAPDDQPAIGLLFSTALPENGNFNEFLSVYRPDGARVDGRWRRAASPQLLYFNVSKPGRYLIRARAGLSAGGSETLTESLSGPVRIGGDGKNAG